MACRKKRCVLSPPPQTPSKAANTILRGRKIQCQLTIYALNNTVHVDTDRNRCTFFLAENTRSFIGSKDKLYYKIRTCKIIIIINKKLRGGDENTLYFRRSFFQILLMFSNACTLIML